MLYISFYITPFREQGLTAYHYGMLCHYYTGIYRICQIKFKHSIRLVSHKEVFNIQSKGCVKLRSLSFFVINYAVSGNRCGHNIETEADVNLLCSVSFWLVILLLSPCKSSSLLNQQYNAVILSDILTSLSQLQRIMLPLLYHIFKNNSRW